LIAAAIGGYLRQRLAAAGSIPSYTTVTAKVSTIQKAVTSNGTIGLSQISTLTSPGSGTVNVKVGDQVQTGQTLITMQSTDLQINLAQARANLASAQERLNEALKPYLVRLGLPYEGFRVLTATEGEDPIRKVAVAKPDVVILDIMLPGLDGFSVCERIRRTHDVAIVMLIARDDVDDRVRGLHLGADDYLSKPFRFEEILARVRAVLRRRQPRYGLALQVGDVRMNVETHDIERGGRPIMLTPREFDLLRLFMEHPRQIFSKETIINRIWGYDFMGDGNVVGVYISSLRDKLEDHPPQLHQTVRGVGYGMIAP